MESKGIGFSASDLAKGSKNLATAKTQECSDSLTYDKGVAEQYTKLFDEFDGDVDKLFDHLNENPRKAKKYPPKDAREFGIKYSQGFYTCVEADAKN